MPDMPEWFYAVLSPVASITRIAAIIMFLVIFVRYCKSWPTSAADEAKLMLGMCLVMFMLIITSHATQVVKMREILKSIQQATQVQK